MEKLELEKLHSGSISTWFSGRQGQSAVLHATERDACIDRDDSVLLQQKREADTS